MTFDLSAFRAAFPQFNSIADEQVQALATQAQCFLSNYGCDCEALMWQLMVAHLLALSASATSGGTSGQVTSASIDKVSVSIAAPPSKDGWSYWLSSSPYGMQLWALIQRCSATGMYVGGLPERSAFRSVGGAFPRGKVWRR